MGEKSKKVGGMVEIKKMRGGAMDSFLLFYFVLPCGHFLFFFFFFFLR